MKKKILPIVLALAVAFAAFGCANSAGPETGERATSVVLNDFENYIADFAPMSHRYFGRVNINTDPAYVRTGSASAKLQPTGDAYIGQVPVLRVPLYYDGKGTDYTDFTKVAMVEIYMYNASDKDVTAEYCLCCGWSMNVVTPSRNITLESGKWTPVRYVVDRTVLELMADIYDVKYLCFTFPIAESIETAPVIYMDSMMLYFAEEEFVPFVAEVEKDEIAFFEDDWQQYCMTCTSSAPYRPSISINTDPQFSVSGRSLKMTFMGNDGTASSEVYPGLTFGSKLVEFAGVREMEPGDKIAVDFYNPNDREVRLWFQFWTDKGQQMFNDGVHARLAAGRWTTLEYSGQDITRGAYAPMGYLGNGGTIGQIGSFGFTWRTYDYAAGEYTVYIDNVRIVRAEEQ